METSTTIDTRCRVLELPTELRLRIYEYVFVDDTYFHCRLVVNKAPTIARFGALVQHDEICPFSSKLLWAHIPREAQCHVSTSLLKACRTIYNETTPILYKTIVFHVWIYGGSFWDQNGQLKGLGLLNTWATIPRIQNLELKLLGNEDHERALGIDHMDRFMERMKENETLKTCTLNTRALPGPLVWEDIQRLHAIRKWSDKQTNKLVSTSESFVFERILEEISRIMEGDF